MRKIILVLLLILIPSIARAQSPVVGASCPASGQTGITAAGVSVICTQPTGGGALVWTATAGGGGGLTQVASLPATCTPGITASVQLTVAPYAIYSCIATNTWGPSSPPAGSTGQLQFNNAGALGGISGSAAANAGTLLTLTGNNGTSQAVVVTSTGSGQQTVLTLNGANSNANAVLSINTSFGAEGPAIATTNCNVNSASPAACGGAPSGSVVVPTTTTTYTVNTTAVTANSRILILPITDASGLSGSPTCNAPPTPFVGYQSGRVAGTSFTFTLPSTTGTSCWTYWIVN